VLRGVLIGSLFVFMLMEVIISFCGGFFKGEFWEVGNGGKAYIANVLTAV
jgi:hypothetical protein